jgi:Annexin
VSQNKYQQLYGKKLERRVGIELSGHMDFLAKWALDGKEDEYDSQIHTASKAEQDAEKIRSMGEGKWGTNENGIIKLVCKSPPKYLQLVNSKYEEKYGNDLVKAIERELNGKLEKATLIILRMKLNPFEQVAQMIHDACKGIGTNEHMLTTYLIRYQVIMKEVDAAHQRLFKKSVTNLVKCETSGDYEKLLVEIVN